MDSVTLDDLVGEHLLDAVDMCTESLKAQWGDHFEDCEVMRFRLDGKVYTAVSDPGDGYRSSMDRLSVTDDPIRNSFAPVRVLARKKDDDQYQKNDVLQLINISNGKIVMEVGTDNIDDYYPGFISFFDPAAIGLVQP